MYRQFVASQVRSIQQYKNLKIKVLKCCASERNGPVE